MRKPYVKSILSYSMVGSIGLTIVASLQGCGGDQPPTPPQNQAPGAISDAAKGEGMFLVIQQTGANPDTYELKEKHPSSEGTRAILKGMDGSERILSEAELKKIAEEEAKKVEDGTSKLTQPAAENQGLSLGETLLASAAGALIGGLAPGVIQLAGKGGRLAANALSGPKASPEITPCESINLLICCTCWICSGVSLARAIKTTMAIVMTTE